LAARPTSSASSPRRLRVIALQCIFISLAVQLRLLIAFDLIELEGEDLRRYANRAAQAPLPTGLIRF
jgi:hypothetical protein